MTQQERKQIFVKILIGTFALLLIIIGIVLKIKHDENVLKSNGAITYGKIYHFGRKSRKGGTSNEYKFFTQNKRYTGRITATWVCKQYLSNQDREEIASTYIPVIYYTKNPNISRMLLIKQQYHKYGIQYPDSISVFLNKYFECK